MKNKHIACAVASALLATSFLSGCATTETSAVSAQQPEAFNKNMAEAEQVVSSGDRDRGVRMYQKIASDNPSRGEPWSRIAQIHFAQNNYSLAIVAAEETLRRDPLNRQAKSVTAVGGLRLAARSLEDLRKDSSLSGDTTADAQRLASLLRETLGTSVLVPATESPKPKPRYVPPVARSAPAPAAAAAAPSPRPSGSGNPFDALK